jgi:hypothetical protein
MLDNSSLRTYVPGCKVYSEHFNPDVRTPMHTVLDTRYRTVS